MFKTTHKLYGWKGGVRNGQTKKAQTKSESKTEKQHGISDGEDGTSTGWKSSVCREARILPLCGSNSLQMSWIQEALLIQRPCGSATRHHMLRLFTDYLLLAPIQRPRRSHWTSDFSNCSLMPSARVPFHWKIGVNVCLCSLLSLSHNWDLLRRSFIVPLCVFWDSEQLMKWAFGH